MTASGDFFRGEDTSSQDESSSQYDSMDSSSQCDSQEESSHVGEESFNSGLGSTAAAAADIRTSTPRPGRTFRRARRRRPRAQSGMSGMEESMSNMTFERPAGQRGICSS